MKSVSTSKLKILLWFVYIFFILNLIFLIRWQVFEHDRFIALARERIVDNKVPSIRGDILARDGSSLAYSEPRFNIIVYKTELEFAEKYKKQTRDEFVSKVGKVLGIKEATLTQMLENDKDWVKITEKITNDKKDELLSLKRDNASDQELEGIRIEYTSERIYPEHELACHAIGFVGKNDIGDDLGRAGLEHYWEGLLKEQEGYNSSEVDSFGNLIALNNVSQIEAKRGATIYTTIDKNIQSIVQKNIQAAVKKYDAKSATAIVMNPKTGEILALANYPDFDPNDY